MLKFGILKQNDVVVVIIYLQRGGSNEHYLTLINNEFLHFVKSIPYSFRLIVICKNWICIKRKEFLMKKIKKRMLPLLSVIISVSMSIQALAIAPEEFDGVKYFSVGSNTEVVIEEGALDMPQEYIDQIVRENPNSLVTISDYVKADPQISSQISPQFVLATVITKKTITKSKYVSANYFVISVAKGATVTLGVEWSKSLSASATHSAAKEPLKLNGTITKTYSASTKFAGPPENSSYNSRSYRVKFYAEDGTYEGYHIHDTGQKIDISGSFRNPIEYAAYSVDSKIN